MNVYKPLILFIGGSERSSALQQLAVEHGWALYLPESVVEALRIHDTYAPDLVIIETIPGNRFVERVYDNLNEFGTRRLIVLTHDPRTYRAHRKLKRTCPDADLLEAINDLLVLPA